MNNFRSVLIIASFAFQIIFQNVSGQIVRANLVQIKGTVQIVHAYKGGAAPTDEMLEQLKQPVPLIATNLFLKKSFYSSKFYVLHADSAGNFDLKIKPGVYNIYLSNENSTAKKTITKNDLQADCEEQYKIQSHGTLRIYKKGNSPLQITIQEKINPCGPLPPAAAPGQN